jgi:hypothetical protein
MNKKKIMMIAAVVAVPLVLALGLIGPGIYRRCYVRYQYDQIITKGKYEAYAAIAKYPDEAFQLAKNELESEDGHPREAIFVLRSLQSTRSTALLGDALERGIEPVATTMSLRGIGTRQAQKALANALDHRESDVRR